MSSPYLSQPLRSEEEVLEGRRISMMEVIRRAARAERGMSDDQLHEEYDAQHMLKRAQEDFESALRLLERINDQSVLVKINIQAFRDVMGDELPTERFWEEKISAARNP